MKWDGREFPARCIRVIDGDTYRLEVDLGFRVRRTLHVRLDGINTPELRSRGLEERERAQAAKRFVETLLLPPPLRWPLIIQPRKGKSFDRWVATVGFITATGAVRDVGIALVDAGHGVVWKR